MLEYKVLICQRERRKRKPSLPPKVYSLGILIDQPVRRGRKRPAATLTYQDGFLEQRTQFTFPVEWVIGLPLELEAEYHLAARQLEQEHKMSYVTIAERYGMAKGEEKGLQKGQASLLLGQIQRRFGPLSDGTVQRIRTAKAAQLETWSLNFVDAAELDDVFRE